MLDTVSNTEHTLLKVVLSPHRSLKPKHFSKLLVILIGICTFAGIRFTVIGAWPVAAFLFVDLVALWFAFYLNYRRGRVRETITLTDKLLTVRRTMPNGTCDSWNFEPYWVKLNLGARNTAKSPLIISLHDQQVNVGAFLTTEECVSLFTKLDTALAKWKNR